MKASEIVRENKGRILEMWIGRLRQEFPQVKTYGKAAIQNDVPDLLDNLVSILEKEDHIKDFAGLAHGKQRANFKEYSLLHVIREYRILKEIIFEVIDDTQRVEPPERDKVMFAVDRATESAAEAFFQSKKNKMLSANRLSKKNIKKLKEAEVSREQFLSSLWHDLNNPLNNIKLSIELMESMVIDPSLERLVKIVKTNADKTGKMIRNLLDVNMVSAGITLPVKKENCSLTKFFKDLWASYELELEGKINLCLNLPETEIEAFVDCNALARAIDNLVSNALKYGDNSQPIELSCTKEGGEILISVTNYGQPIPAEKQNDIFKRFYRVKDSPETGLGIGLHVVKGVAEAHGGHATVKSSQPSGTVFTIALPASDSRETRREKPAKHELHK